MPSKRVALVTGGSRGIGAAIAQALANSAVDVAITYRRGDASAEAVCRDIRGRGQRALAFRADSTDSSALVAAVDQTRAELGRLDILVNNAGIFPYGLIDEATVDQLDEAMAVHARAAFVSSKAALRHMGQGGRIISIGSCLADRVPNPGLTVYAMSKSALIGFTKGLARDVGSRGITVNLVQPGSTDTDMNPATAPDADAERAHSALGRYADAAEVAAVVAFLASPASAYVTGASIAVDGGYSA